MTSNIRRAMHPRNIFNTPPDFTELAIKYPDFRRVCKLELCGKVHIDYKNEQALRALTKTLLLEYFKLDVEFAPGSLIPTLPLRLNYILWLEDLLTDRSCNSTVKGIDIGCGSSCIYSLLAAKKNGWPMVALETNKSNLEYAASNIERNNLTEMVSLFAQKQSNQIFEEFFQTTHDKYGESMDSPYDFCLCNPPFFDSQQTETCNTRNPKKRPPPHNCPTGYKEELSCLGGEVKFVEKIIDESIRYKTNIRIFTSMLGLKSSLNQITGSLSSRNMSNWCTTKFHQGNTTRWGIAWTFCTDIDLK
ncbi:U6 small nuclear RNA (adenine-(43)-N(6))-methyltransferase [Musca vetustissima]|uniref:U6 small nuclear RNA (adenine-(43)-N(6))-methyltransferase n=1 Tax=Musca vetustissima TaxID=27455 RepID=UPI002AB66FE9|nr:U6 small nuclear RNA (adenine-(43)-N(6))-methyltransferase [Musca vetustissima]